MKLRRVLLSLLACLLLFAQQAAYSHAVSHLGSEPPAKEQLGHSKLCGKCVSFEKLSGAAPSGNNPLATLTLVYAQPIGATLVFRPGLVVAFRSRAPPVLL